MKGNFQVRFLGGSGAERLPSYPVQINKSLIRKGVSMWTCPKCREHIADALDYCLNCGIDRNCLPMSDINKELKRAMGTKELYIDTRQGLFFCVIGGLLGSVYCYFAHPQAPAALSETITKIKLASAGNEGINRIVTILTKEPNCYIISGLIGFGTIGYVVDKLIGNGNSILCKISHFISCSDSSYINKSRK